MERKPYIVLGEAPESDSEEEVNVTPVSRIFCIQNATVIYAKHCTAEYIVC